MYELCTKHWTTLKKLIYLRAAVGGGTEEYTGDIVQFETARSKKLKNLIVSLSPIQSGSGDPSPDNVRPITGRTGASAWLESGNLFRTLQTTDVTSYGITCTAVDDDSECTLDGTATATIGFTVANCPVENGKTYTVRTSSTSSNCIVNVRAYNGTTYVKMIRATSADGTTTFTVDDTFDIVDVRPTVSSGLKVDNAVVKFAITYGENTPSYEPYQGNLYSVDWTDEAGTVYSGTVDLVTGEGVADMEIGDLGTWNWTMYSVSQGNLFRSPVIQNAELPYDEINLLCSHYPIVKASQRTDNSVSVGSVGRIDVIDTRYADEISFKTAMNGVKVVYPLATPIHFTVPEQTIMSLVGHNVVFSPDGSVTVRV